MRSGSRYASTASLTSTRRPPCVSTILTARRGPVAAAGARRHRPARRPALRRSRKWSAWGFTVVHVYGLTETYGPITVCQYQARLGRPARRRARRAAGPPGRRHDHGRPGPCVSWTTRWPTSRPTASTMGEIVMRGNTVMAGVLPRPGGHRRGVPRRLVPQRGPRRHATPTGTSNCATAPRTSSSPAGRTSPRSRWSRRS